MLKVLNQYLKYSKGDAFKDMSEIIPYIYIYVLERLLLKMIRNQSPVII